MLVMCRHGVPDSILSDQGKNFQSNLLNELWELLDVHKLRTTPYHPECDGLSERFNRTLKTMITAFVTDDQQDTWDQYLPMLAFAYNTAVHSSTNTTPFEMIYGRQPKIPIDIFCEEKKVDLQLTPDAYASHISKVLEDAYKRVRENTELKMSKAKIRHDRNVRAANFDVNDLVWVYDPAKKPGRGRKFIKKWKGPYRVISIIDETGYVVKPVNRNGRSKQVNQKHLKRCFKHKIISSGCNDVQLLVEKTRRGRPRKKTSESAVRNEKTAKEQASKNAEEIVVDSENIPDIVPDLELEDIYDKVPENNVEVTPVDDVLRRSTRVRRQPDRYANV